MDKIVVIINRKDEFGMAVDRMCSLIDVDAWLLNRLCLNQVRHGAVLWHLRRGSNLNFKGGVLLVVLWNTPGAQFVGLVLRAWLVPVEVSDAPLHTGFVTVSRQPCCPLVIGQRDSG